VRDKAFMQLHHLKSGVKRKTKKRVGRGGKRGTYSGRGIKGQKARAGKKLQPAARLFIKRYPKKRGYRFKSIKEKEILLNLSDLENKFKNGSLVSPKILLRANLISKMKGKMPLVKILGRGRLTKELTFKNCNFSRSAKEKIEKAGGTT